MGRSLKTHCKNGHEFTEENTRINKRGDRACRKCGNIQSHIFYNKRKHKEDFVAHVNERSRQYIQNNKEKRKETVGRYHELNKDKIRSDKLKRVYGISSEEYDRLFAQQNGVCKVCRKECSKRLAVDHCHETNKIRGLLCFNCNIAIGYAKDSPMIIRCMADYLENS